MKIIAVLKLPKPVTKLSTFAKSVVAAMTNNPSFPSPNPALAVIEADDAELDAAEALVLTRAHGKAKARDVKLAVLRDDLEHLRAYVQEVADLDPTTAASVVESAGMSVKGPPTRNKEPFVAKQGGVPGSAHLVAKAVAKRASYEWQVSADGTNFTTARTTIQAETTLTGLAPGRLYYFRVRPGTKAGLGNFSQVISFYVQ
jgi:hypothetical protein